jgi:hypothetical protein
MVDTSLLLRGFESGRDDALIIPPGTAVVNDRLSL